MVFSITSTFSHLSVKYENGDFISKSNIIERIRAA